MNLDLSQLIENYKGKEDKLSDPLRGGLRIEIPSGFALAALRDAKQSSFARDLLAVVRGRQLPSGAWEEFAYAERERKIAYDGTVPTCFAVIALVRGFKKFGLSEYFDAAKRGVDYLYGREKNGYFPKASFNKSDVVNTNLLAGLTLLEFASILDGENSFKGALAAGANRALLRSVKSQFLNGAFPYISFGFSVPFLYQAMSTALMGICAQETNNQLALYSFQKGLRYLRKIIGEDGKFLWQKSNHKDKEGAVWAYGWAAAAFSVAGDGRYRDRVDQRLNELRGKEFMKVGDFDERDDLFFTAWTVAALSLGDGPITPLRAASPWSAAWFCFIRLLALPPRVAYLTKIMQRNVFRKVIDKGPAEDY
jgi:hypothetical protein